MTLTVAIISPGAMGSAIGRRVADHGVWVLTSLAGRGAATRLRARNAGMRDAPDDPIAGADVILSIVPPAEAVAVAERFAAALARAPRKAIYADCNAVSAATLAQIAAIIAPTGAAFVDGGIIGLPPGPGGGPTLYFSGDAAPRLEVLGESGLRVRVMNAPVGAASALKLSYAGINKGITLLSAAMVLAATRAGAAPALRAELAESQPELLARLGRALPDMLPKVWRWGHEMLEIADFVAEDAAAAEVFRALEAVCRHLAHDADGTFAAALKGFVRPG